MPALRDYRRRITSVKSTQKICKAMKAVATAKMSKAQAAVVSARPYASQIHDVLGRLSAAAKNVQHPLLAKREPKKVCYVVISADRGLCGGFNSNILRRAQKEISGLSNPSLVAVGRKSQNFFKFRGVTMDKYFVNLGETIRPEQAKEIARFVIEQYSTAGYDKVYVIYSKFVNILVQQPTVLQLLPVETPAGEEKKESHGPEAQYIFEPSAEEVLADLLPRYVENAIFAAMLESKAGELCARMTAMENASKNAGEMIDRLTLQMNRLRQEGITKELLDIVGGAAALE